MINVAINGFGRIGRITLRYLLNKPGINVVAINDLTDINTLVHLLKYDSLQGKFLEPITVEGSSFRINDHNIRICSERDPSLLPWKELGVDIVLECTGIFRSREKAALHIQAGARKVIISAPAQGGDIPTVVKGVNEDIIDASVSIISNASCTTNCAAPLIKLIHDAYKINNGTLTTVHAYTSDQRLIDAPHSDLRRARAAAMSIIPTSTGAAKAVGLVIPSLKGKLEGIACRVPVPVGSFTDLTLIVENAVSVEEINNLVKESSRQEMNGIIEYSEEPLVSIDIVGNSHSCIFDADLTAVNNNLVKLGAWYDNEYGYSARLADVTEQIAAFC